MNARSRKTPKMRRGYKGTKHTSPFTREPENVHWMK
jgi:hypothetical protein